MRWLLLQIADSAFPIGGFAHSAGLEAAMHHGGRVELEQLIWQTARGALPLVNAAHAGDAEVVDRATDVILSQHVANRASRAQGRAFLSTCEKAFGLTELRARAEHWPQHFAPMFGAALACLGASQEETRMTYLFGAVRGFLGAAVRLGLIGPYAAQKHQADAAPICEKAVRASAAWGLDDVAQTSPLLDAWQAGHDRLYSRLFQS